MKFFNKNNLTKKILLTTCVVVVSVCLSLVLYWYKAYNDRVVPLDFNKNNHIGGKGNIKKDGNGVNYLKEEKKHIDIKKVEGLTNILLLGTDGRTEEGKPLSDTVIILTIDGNHNDIKLSSIPRDTYCRIPGIRDQKINAAYSNGGKELLIETIYENFDISLDKYVEINFEGFKSIVDYLEGIDIYLNNYEEVNELNRVILLEINENPKYTNRKVKNIINKANLLLTRDVHGAPLIINNPYITEEEYNYLCDEVGLIEKEGMNHLNGSQLLAYSRMRHFSADLSSRTERQRKVIELIMKKLSKTSVANYYGIANELLNHITTNIPLSEAVGLAAQAMDINNFDVKKMQVPPEHLSAGLLYPGFHYSYVFLMDEENTTKALHEFIFDDIEFDENKYPRFSYENSKYYVELPDENYDADSENNEDNTEERDDEESQNNEESEKENTNTTEEEKQDNDMNKVDNEDLDRKDGNDDTQYEDEEENEDSPNKDDSSSQENNEAVDENISDKLHKNDKNEENTEKNEQESNDKNKSSEEINNTEKDNSEDNPNTEEEDGENITEDSGNIEEENANNEESEDNNDNKEDDGIVIDLD